VVTHQLQVERRTGKVGQSETDGLPLCYATEYYWTLGKNEETRLDAFEMKGLRKILRVSWTAKKTNEWVLNKAGVNEGTVRHRQSKEASILSLNQLFIGVPVSQLELSFT